MDTKNLKTFYLKRALKLARKAQGLTSPNPMVGAIIVKNKQIIGEGYHLKSGEPHAEVLAIENASSSVRGATVYCTLEPCCHKKKKTPPCTDLLIEKGIKQVHVCSLDPNPKVAGKGLKKLEKHGIKTSYGTLQEEENELNKIFRTNMLRERPFVQLKIAQTLDGFMIDSFNESKWITDEDARKDVHKLRSLFDGILVGKNTAIRDNPKLNLRYGLEKFRNPPKAIILGRKQDLTSDHFLNNESTLFVQNSSPSRVLNALKEKNIHSVMIEGGPKVLASFYESKLFDEIVIYIAPKIIGSGTTSFEHISPISLNNDFDLKLVNVKKIQDQMRLTYKQIN